MESTIVQTLCPQIISEVQTTETTTEIAPEPLLISPNLFSRPSDLLSTLSLQLLPINSHPHSSSRRSFEEKYSESVNIITLKCTESHAPTAALKTFDTKAAPTLFKAQQTLYKAPKTILNRAASTQRPISSKAEQTKSKEKGERTKSNKKAAEE